MAHELTGDIEELMARAGALRKQPGVDKKAINKVVARLEEAWLWSRVLLKPVDVKDPESGELVTASGTGECTCPPGARDSECPVHGDQA